MVIEIKDIRLYKILLEDIDEKILSLENNENKLFIAEKELKALNKKHSGLSFCFRILGFTLLCFIALRMLYVLLPKEFPYYCIAPVPGIIIELVLRNKFIDNEKKQAEKSLKKDIKAYKEENDTIIKEIQTLVPIIKEAKKKLTTETDIMSDNIQALNYIARNEAEYNKVSFEVRYNEFVNKVKCIDTEQYPDLKELKEEILKYNDITIYRNVIMKNITKETAEHEKNDNAVSDTEKK